MTTRTQSLHSVASLLFGTGLVLLLTACGPQSDSVESSTVGTAEVAEPSPSSDQSVASPVSEKVSTQYGHLQYEYALPPYSYNDWVDFGDVYATVRVVSVERIPLSKEDQERSEGVLVSARINVELLSILWQRPGGPNPPREFSFETLGWIVNDGKEYPMVGGSGARYITGESYADVFANFRESGWNPLAGESAAHIGAEGKLEVPVPEGQKPSSLSNGLERSIGRTPAEVAADLAKTARNPLLVDLPGGLDPKERFAVLSPE